MGPRLEGWGEWKSDNSGMGVWIFFWGGRGKVGDSEGSGVQSCGMGSGRGGRDPPVSGEGLHKVL